MANPNPRTDHFKKYKPGQSGNPGGFTAEMKAMQAKAGLLATKQRLRLLEAWDAMPVGELIERLNSDMTATVKQADDRLNGAPKETIDATHNVISHKPVTEKEWLKLHGGEAPKVE